MENRPMSEQKNKPEINFNQELQDAIDRCTDPLSFEDIILTGRPKISARSRGTKSILCSNRSLRARNR